MPRRRIAASLFITLFLLTAILLTTLAIVPRTARAAILYVGGVGPGNYTTIQSAINAANPGDTVIVYGGIYYEHIVVDRTLSLVGEDRDTSMIDGGGSGDLIRVGADWTNITGFTLANSGIAHSGIVLDSVRYVAILNNRVSSNIGIGFFLISASRNNISNNIFLDNWNNLAAISAEGNVIMNNTISNGSFGLDFSYCSNTTIAGNTISNTSSGIRLSTSSNMTLTGNVMVNTGIIVGGKLNHWNTHTIDTSNMVNGKPVQYRKDIVGGVIPPSAGQVILANTIRVAVENQNLSETSTGIQVGFSSLSIIANNIVSENKMSGIHLEECTNITIANNTVSSSTRPGIMLSYSANITLANNTMVNNGVYIWGDLPEYWDSHTIDTSNTVNAKPLHYWRRMVGGTIPMGAGQVILANSTGVEIGNQDFGNGTVGVQLGFSSGNTIINNSIYSNDWEGITIYHSDGNTIANNVVVDNMNGIEFINSVGNMLLRNNISSNHHRGIDMASSDGNTICNNNIIDNNEQANDFGANIWDGGYPSGGNYWSDYTGIDVYGGPNQNVPGADSIGDTPYDIPGGSNNDKYPLMKPIGFSLRLPLGHRFVSFPVKVVDESIQSVLSSISGCYDYVSWFDPHDSFSPWKSYVPKRGTNSLLGLNNTMGFWINMTSICTLVLPGVRPSTTSISLHAGWNMAGFPSFNSSYTVADLKADVGLDGVIVEAFDARTAPYSLQRVNESYVMKAGEGYWIFVPSDAAWIAKG